MLVLQAVLLFVQLYQFLVDGVDQFLARANVLIDQVDLVLGSFLVLLGLLDHLTGVLNLLGILLLLCLQFFQRLRLHARYSQQRYQ